MTRTSKADAGPRKPLDSRIYHCDQWGMERTIFCVQPYRRGADGLRKGHMRRLLSREAAIKAARAMRGCEAGVVVFRVTGSPSADYWSDPVLIARAGDVPAEVGL